MFSFGGDPFELITVRSNRAEQLPVRSWGPAGGLQWFQIKSYSFRGPSDYGLPIDWRASFPKLGATNLIPHFLSIVNAGLILSFRLSSFL